MRRWAPLVISGLAAAVAAFVLGLQVFSGAQPWGMLLTDNFLLARSLPFTLALGIAFGAGRAVGRAQVATLARGDALRHFAPGTASMYWLTALAVVLGLVTGAWQYLKGLLAVNSRIDMPLVYRVHYLAATLLLFAAAHFVTYWLMSDTRRPLGQFTYYEKAVSLPTWGVVLTVLVVSGVLKAMRYIYPIPGDVLWWVSAIHVAGMVALMVKLLDHLRYVLAPSRWPLLIPGVTAWVVAALGVVWALGNLGVAYLFFTSGIAARNIHKGLGVQASLVVAAVLVTVFALLLLAQGFSLARSRLPD